MLPCLFRNAFLVCLLFGELFAQNDSLNLHLTATTFTRHRIFFGYSHLLPDYPNEKTRALFFNYNYRSSPLNKFTNAIKLGSAIEYGINIVYLNEWEGTWEYSSLLLPYVKYTPELYLGKNVFLSGSIGLAVALIYGFYIPIVPIPFAGLNSIYLIDLSNEISLEFEGGFHTFYGPEKAPFLFYFNVGVSHN